MPSPQYIHLDYDPDEQADPRIEIMGRGRSSRKSKTLIPTIELATILGLVREKVTALIEQFRILHAKHYNTKVPVLLDDGAKKLDEDGNVVWEVVPEILTDDQIRSKYHSVREWEDFHAELVDHFPSVGGFSTKAALGYDEKQVKRERKQQEHSSAGSDRDSSRWD